VIPDSGVEEDVVVLMPKKTGELAVATLSRPGPIMDDLFSAASIAEITSESSALMGVVDGGGVSGFGDAEGVSGGVLLGGVRIPALCSPLK
jgi:hypothetical protein